MTDLTTESAAVKLAAAYNNVSTGYVLERFFDPTTHGLGLTALERLAAEHERICSERIAAAEKAEAERTETFEAICDALGIGIFARDRQTILMNIRNLLRRGACLSVVEDVFQESCGEGDDQITTSKLSWGASPKEFEKQFNAALAAAEKVARVKALEEALLWVRPLGLDGSKVRHTLRIELADKIRALITAAEAQPEGKNAHE
jgi:hypothetical protein